ncbi:tol-pal system YbgF family protein [Streptomyces sp. NPDC057638]|uniref:tetratricopeptide repeat protein n=1 Tax=Streptomyces sp. NPDC057638 TaxID=3346190 RepID=UPI0036A5F016
MARNAPNKQLKELLLEADWTARELAEAINSEGSAQSLNLRYDRTSVAHWLRGSRPRPPVPQLIAAVFARRLRRPVLPGDTGLVHEGIEPGQDSKPNETEPEDDPLARLVSLTRADVLPTTRSALTRMIYTPASITPPTWPATRAPSPGPPSGTIGPQTADTRALEEMAVVFARQMGHRGGGHGRSALAAYLTDDAATLLARSSDGAQHRGLLVQTAELSHLLAKMTFDTDFHALAQSYLLTALDLAHQAHDRRTYAITLRTLSLQALERGHPQAAADLADAAVHTAPQEISGATRAFLLAQRALTHAHGRRHHEALTDLIDAEHHHDPDPKGQGPFATYPRAGFHYQRGEILLALDELPQALQAFDSSTHHRRPHDNRQIALTQARRAETLLRLGHLDAACNAWHAFLQHYPLLRSTRADSALARLQTNLRPYLRHPHAAHAHDTAQALSRTRTRPPPRVGLMREAACPGGS